MVVLLGSLGTVAQIWTEVAWYRQLDRLAVLLTNWGYRVGLLVVGVLVVAGISWINLAIAGRGGNSYPSLRGLSDPVAQLRANIEPIRKLLVVLAPLFFAVFVALPLMTEWETFVAWLHATPWGEKDPIFGLDNSFYVFSLPALQEVVSLLLKAMVMALGFSAVTYYLSGQLSPTTRSSSRKARIHLSVLLSLSAVIVAAYYFLGRYWLLLSNYEKFSGASYTDVHAVLPARNILVGISLVVALMFLIGAFRKSWRLPLTGIGVMALSVAVVGGVYPTLVQRFEVDPSAQELEAPYIKHNIEATRKAFGIEDVKEETYAAKTTATTGQLRADSNATTQIRLLDPNVISRTFGQIEQIRQYYRFPQNLTVDRYEIDGEVQDTVIAVRELDNSQLGQSQKSWVNQHTVFTHGFGVVAAYGSKVQGDGTPDFWEHGIPSQGALGEYEPRIYFGQYSPDYSIVGGPKDGAKQEFDYPADSSKDRQVNNTYAGQGGPSIGNAWERLMYAIRFQSTEVFFSKQVNAQSQILFNRNPADRVRQVAPYLTLDKRIYPAVVDMDGDPKTPKRVVWIIDAYTTSDNYPYSRHRMLGETTADSLTGAVGEQFGQRVNYMRNSVKAVVDAYDGSVKLFQWDEEDPILQTWSKVFPGQIEPLASIPGDLMAHLRYPEDLFKMQRDLIASYHTTDPRSFYSGSDFWKLPTDPTHEETTTEYRLQPPYYLTMQAPGQKSAEFSLYSTYIPYGSSDRNVLTGYLTVDSETGNTKGKKRAEYGKMRLLALPSDLAVPGPGQVSNKFKTTDSVSQTLNLLNQNSTRVVRGNLLTLPVGGGLLYVQPVYVEGKSGSSYPLLRFVLTAFGDQIGFAPTLQGSLDMLFGGDSGAVTGEEPGDGQSGTSDTGQGTVELSPDQQLGQALREAKTALEDGQNALKNGDWSGYGAAQQKLQEALSKAVQLGEQTGKIPATGDVQADEASAPAAGGSEGNTGEQGEGESATAGEASAGASASGS